MAGLISVGLGFENPYWAMVSAVVPVVGRATSTQLVRAGHRLVGTLLGVGVFWLYYQVYIVGPETILPASWHNPPGT